MQPASASPAQSLSALRPHPGLESAIRICPKEPDLDSEARVRLLIMHIYHIAHSIQFGHITARVGTTKRPRTDTSRFAATSCHISCVIAARPRLLSAAGTWLQLPATSAASRPACGPPAQPRRWAREPTAQQHTMNELDNLLSCACRCQEQKTAVSTCVRHDTVS